MTNNTNNNTATWPTQDQINSKSILVPQIPHVMGRRAFLPETDHAPEQPTRRITDHSLMQDWLKSEAFVRLIDFIQSLNKSAVNCAVSVGAAKARSSIVVHILKVFDLLDAWIDEIPPDTTTASRFGNIAFRSWIDRLNRRAHELHLLLFNGMDHPAILELIPYLTGGFGDGTRMDYGSGHELSFVAWLCCLDLIGVIKSDDYCVIVLVVFVRYLDLVRKLQKMYNLEPAGSHGVWGLDDFQFLPYFFGSSQLLDHPKIKPKSIVDKDIVSYFAKEYLYLGCINFILENKKGPFHEHSPILWDISGVTLWSKVNSGMLKMYIAEVLMKFPVVQHFLFGSLLPFIPMLDIQTPVISVM